MKLNEPERQTSEKENFRHPVQTENLRQHFWKLWILSTGYASVCTCCTPPCESTQDGCFLWTEMAARHALTPSLSSLQPHNPRVPGLMYSSAPFRNLSSGCQSSAEPRTHSTSLSALQWRHPHLRLFPLEQWPRPIFFVGAFLLSLAHWPTPSRTPYEIMNYPE